jgi:hypothetical protein
MAAAHPFNYAVPVPFQSTSMELSVVLQIIMYTIGDEFFVCWLDHLQKNNK